MSDLYAEIVQIAKQYEKQTGCTQDFKFFTKKFVQEKVVEVANYRIGRYAEPLCYSLRASTDAQKRSRQENFLSHKTKAEAKISALTETLVANYIRSIIPNRIKPCSSCKGSGFSDTE